MCPCNRDTNGSSLWRCPFVRLSHFARTICYLAGQRCTCSMTSASWPTTKEPDSSSSASSLSVPTFKPKKLLTLFLLCTAISLVPSAIFLSYVTYKPFQHPPLLEKVIETNSSYREDAASGTSRLACDVNASSNSASSSIECFKHGTVPGLGTKMCVCRDGWHGADCAVPSAVWSTPAFRKWYSDGLVRRRSRPRAVFNGITLNHELDLLEIHVAELSDVVDRYVVVESNTTFFGAAKPLYLQSNLRAGGYLGEHARKIVPLTLGPLECDRRDPFCPEYRSRNFTWHEGQRWLGNVADDDLFLLTDVDELPNRDVVLFLKYHDGYGEPIGLTLRSFLYGFFWEHRRATRVFGACTIAFLRTVYANNVEKLRQGRHATAETMAGGTGTVAEAWIVEGARPRFAGWHCSWCFNATGIQQKLMSAQRDDGVRWGDMAQDRDLSYIETLRRDGKFFDERQGTVSVNGYDAAPAYVMRNKKLLLYLLEP